MRSVRSTADRALAALLVLAAVTGIACATSREQVAPSTPARETQRAIASDLLKHACERLDPEVLARVYRGTDPARGGDIQLIPVEPNYARGLTHATPFDLTQRVPLFLYGPGFIRPGIYRQEAGLVDIAPTTAALLRFDAFDAPDGHVLSRALMPAAGRQIPRLIVTLVWDAAGMDLLERWPRSWPYLRSLRSHGAWFPNAYLNTSPSNTPPSHATIGTGAYPRTHGVMDEYTRVDGEVILPLASGPGVMLLPTLGDRYGEVMGDRVKIAGIGSLSAHLLMMGRGTAHPGGQRQIAVTREPTDPVTGGDESSDIWRLPAAVAPYYRFPDYVNDPRFDEIFDHERESLDRMDGKLDGHWRDIDIAAAKEGFDTPARSPWQTAIAEEMIRREGLGTDDETDLFFLNYKVMDTLGHLFSADSVEVADALSAQDHELERFINFLDEQVGRRMWTLIVTADHGMQRDPAVSGAFVIDIAVVRRRIEERFGGTDERPLIDQLRPTQAWLNMDVLRDGGFTLEDVAAFLLGLTQEDTTGGGGSEPIPGHERDPILDAALPSDLLADLPCLRAGTVVHDEQRGGVDAMAAGIVPT